MVNRTTGKTKGNCSLPKVAHQIEAKFTKAGANASVRAGKTTIFTRIIAWFSRDTVYVVTYVDKPAANCPRPNKGGHGSGGQLGPTENDDNVVHVGKVVSDNPLTSTNERENALANAGSHEVGHDLLDSSHVGLNADNSNHPADVMTSNGPQGFLAAPLDFNRSDSAVLKAVTK